MLFQQIATAFLAGIGLAHGLAITPFQEHSNPDSCAQVQSGEVVLVSLKIVEYPVVIDAYYSSNTIINVVEQIYITINNAPIYLKTTVSVTSTTTVTSTVSTATVTVAPAGNSVSTGSSFAAVKPVTSVIESGTVPYASVSAVVSPVAGGPAAGQGLNTGLFTATTASASASVSLITNTLHFTNGTTSHTSTLTSTSTVSSASATATVATGDYTNWKVYKGNGVNLGAWLEQEKNLAPSLFAIAPNATDEWTLCQALGSACGATLEERFATYVTIADIDKLASVGVDILRIPTTYAAWIDIGNATQLYHGNQQTYLQLITEYAISKYGMRVIIGLHSLPGGVNMLDIGEAIGHDAWFNSAQNLAWSFDAINAIISFIQNSGNPWAFTIAPINEASDNIAGFATPAGLTANGTTWIVNYINGVLDRVAAVDSRIPVMLQDSFLGEEFWSPYFNADANLVIDSHIYYFAASGIYSQYVQPAICGQAAVAGGDGKFPVFIGEWSVQTLYNNTYADRKSIFNTERYAWSKYVQGGTFWNIRYDSDTAVDGEGGIRDYWDYMNLIDAGAIEPIIANATYC
ncbi:hypothetical protein PVAG01_07314 [Phlyctema vagabunda]|uniref:glucan 1,3-beta-glucosidase n=1 Tax=Phlyctema vagabunda TaxID=108571 RepID=A0ABR4PC75_9HELO